MGNFNADLSDFSSQVNTGQVGPLIGITSMPPGENKPNDGVSTIEKSKEVAVYFMPVAGFPSLIPPQEGGTEALSNVMTTRDSSDLEGFFRGAQMQIDSLTNDLLDGWSKNIQQNIEEVKRIINSPSYLQLQEIQSKGDPSQGNISGTMTVNAASSEQNRGAAVDNASVASFLNHHAQNMERVSGAASASESSEAGDASKMVIPFVAAAMIGGALALGAFETTVSVNGINSSPVSGALEIVERLQPVVPHLLTDALPTVNLLVMPLIYFTSWDSSIGNMRNKEEKVAEDAAKNFAKEVIGLVSNPAFIKISFVEELSPASPGTNKEHRVAMMKLILACVALSLLYSEGVGKVIGGKFLGMEPMEFQALLSGSLSVAHPTQQGKSFTESQMLQNTLIQQIRAQLDVLPPDEKTKILNAIFEYFSVPRNMKSMLAPSEVIKKALESGTYDPLGTQLDKQAV